MFIISSQHYITKKALIAIGYLLFFIFKLNAKSTSLNHCSTPPPGCFLNCPDGYETFAGDLCLCLCSNRNRHPLTCFEGQTCKSNERCLSVNGKIECVPVAPVNEHDLHQFAASPVVPRVVSSAHLGPREDYQLAKASVAKPNPTIGECPSLVSGNCEVQCRKDADCPTESLRCCPNGCGRECVLSSSPLTVVPFRSHLPIRPLKISTTGGDIEPESSNSGNQLAAAQCETIKCSNGPLYECQLVEADCGRSPCPPVPKCLINPCPSGSPMKLPSGVTALCKRQRQCSDGFWCHQIGYNGLGFCCPEPRKLAKSGECEWHPIKRRNNTKNEEEDSEKCTAKCNSDADCSWTEKCCFNGCGLGCQPAKNGQDQGSTTQKLPIKSTELAIARPTKNRNKSRQEEKEEDADEEEQQQQNHQTPSGGSSAQEGLVKMDKDVENEEGSTPSTGIKIGQCPKIADAANRKWSFCKGKLAEDECQNDGDCPRLQKCCLNGCGWRMCQFPAISSKCLSLQAAAQIFTKFSKHNRAFQPICDRFGRFLPVQTSTDNFRWCVDSNGVEVPGTRAPKEMFEGCDRRRICPIIECPVKCAFGHQMDGLGCPQCICRDSPCRSIQCPESMLCRMIGRKCLDPLTDGEGEGITTSTSTCLIPECIVNSCLQGEPLEDAETGAMLSCDEQKGKGCPPGYYCQKQGIGDKGYCCNGLVLQSELILSANNCPAMPNLAYKRKEWTNEEGAHNHETTTTTTKHALGCRFSRECTDGGEFCCFNGWEMECTKEIGEEVKEKEREPEMPKEEKRENNNLQKNSNNNNDDDVQRHSTSSASCPAYLGKASNPGCVSNCVQNAECAQRSAHMLCCPVGCGQQCQFPEQLRPCVHLLATALREVDKISSTKLLSESLGRPTVQCTPEGLFQPVQFDALTGQYWCVDPLTGTEQHGTRISSSPIGSALPDCSIRHQCSIKCPKERMQKCEHGIKLDHRGCPPNEHCECRNPCEDFKCSLADTEICILKRVICLDEDGNGPCPSIPYCVKNICSQLGLELANNTACSTSSSESDCQHGGDGHGQCRLLVDEQQSGNSSRIGLCCVGQERQFEQPPLAVADAQNSLMASPIIEDIHHHHQMEETKQGICPDEVAAQSPAENGEDGTAEECTTAREQNQCIRDNQCPGVQKCCLIKRDCRQCVQPILATNCQNLLSSFKSLGMAHIRHFIPQPNCDPKRGTFSHVQCDNQAYCWCVDPQFGRPILGTRKLQPVGDFCSDRKKCGIFCPQRRLLECPFGVELDLDGCPLTSECQCRNLCDQVQCPSGQICLLKPRDCQERERNENSQCLPAPTCQPSPCGGSFHPALGTVSKLLLHCHSMTTVAEEDPCPRGYQCIHPLHPLQGHSQEHQKNICCPLEDGEKIRPKGEEEEGAPSSIGGTSKGPNPCNLPLDQGEQEHCTQGKMELRFYHDYSEQSCEEFIYAGCGGNENNFRSKEECEQRCLGPQTGQGANPSAVGEEMFNIRFKLSPPPPSNQKDVRRMESSLHSYLIRNFGLEKDQVRDIHLERNGGNVHFTIISLDARRKAKSISDLLASGQFQFQFDDQLYRAQSDSLFAQQVPLMGIDDAKHLKTSKSPLFWVILTSSIFFALIVVLAICCGYAFLHNRSWVAATNGIGDNDNVTFTPSPQIGAIHHHWSPIPAQRKMTERSLSPEEMRRMRAKAAGGGAAHLLTPLPSSTSSAYASTHLPSQKNTPIIAPKIISEDAKITGRKEQQQTMYY